MSQKRTYKHYPKKFKEEAVALVMEQGYAGLTLGTHTRLPQHCGLGGFFHADIRIIERSMISYLDLMR